MFTPPVLLQLSRGVVEHGKGIIRVLCDKGLKVRPSQHRMKHKNPDLVQVFVKLCFFTIGERRQQRCKVICLCCEIKLTKQLLNENTWCTPRLPKDVMPWSRRRIIPNKHSYTAVPGTWGRIYIADPPQIPIETPINLTDCRNRCRLR